MDPYFLTLSLVLFVVASGHQAAATNLVQSNGFASECGRTLHVTNSVRIEYKLSQEFDLYELCPFILRFDGAASLRFDLIESGIPTYGKLNVATLESSGTSPVNLTLKSLDMFNSSGPVTLAGTIAIVTFSSYSDVGTGFALNVTRVGDSDIIMSPESIDKVLEGRQGYSNNELSAFVIAPSEYKTECAAVECTELRIEFSIQSGCYDKINLFAFDRFRFGGWIRSFEFCDNHDANPLVLPGVMVLVVLSTDDSITSSGFGVEFETSY